MQKPNQASEPRPFPVSCLSCYGWYGLQGLDDQVYTVIAVRNQLLTVNIANTMALSCCFQVLNKSASYGVEDPIHSHLRA
jgi:hypothetical protein